MVVPHVPEDRRGVEDERRAAVAEQTVEFELEHVERRREAEEIETQLPRGADKGGEHDESEAVRIAEVHEHTEHIPRNGQGYGSFLSGRIVFIVVFFFPQWRSRVCCGTGGRYATSRATCKRAD